MLEVRMTRDELKSCIEDGIAGADETEVKPVHVLTDEEKAKLRAVGETMPHVAFGDWKVSNHVSCGCPVIEAKLINPPHTKNRDYQEFTWYYDKAVVDRLNALPVLSVTAVPSNFDSKYGIIFVVD